MRKSPLQEGNEKINQVLMYPKLCKMRVLTLTELLVLAAVQVLVLQTKSGKGKTLKLHISATFQMHPQPREDQVV